MDPNPPPSRHSHGWDYLILLGWSVFINVLITLSIVHHVGGL